MIVNQGVYRYTHKPDLAANWLSLEDLAKFMVAAISRPDLIGKKIRVGGPERLTTLQMLDILSDVLGRRIALEFITPRQFGENFYALYGAESGLDRDAYVNGFDSFYTFNNDSPRRPFQADVDAALKLIPIKLTNLRSWAEAQNWS